MSASRIAIADLERLIHAASPAAHDARPLRRRAHCRGRLKGSHRTAPRGLPQYAVICAIIARRLAGPVVRGDSLAPVCRRPGGLASTRAICGEGPPRAPKFGVAFSRRQQHHFGVAAHHVEPIAPAGLVVLGW